MVDKSRRKFASLIWHQTYDAVTERLSARK